MNDALASTVIDTLRALKLGGTGQDASNRFTVDGVTLESQPDDALVIGVRSLEATSLRLTSAPFVFEIGRIALRQLVAQVRFHGGIPRLHSLEAAGGELSGVKIGGPLIFSPAAIAHSHASHFQPGASSLRKGAWELGPLAAVDGHIRAEIVDAHLVFDAVVTVPIRRGTVDFNEATVDHVGPDSRMGVSRLGIYVDAPNGRSYIFQFPTAPVAGVEFERRSGMLGGWVRNRGNLRLQPLAEGLLLQSTRGSGVGFTEEARLLFGRTALAGHVQLSDGRFSAPGVEADFAGRAQGRNAIRLHSQAVGRGLTAEMVALSLRHAVLNAGDRRLSCDEITGALSLRVLVEGKQLRFEFDVPEIKVSGVRIPSTADHGE